MRINLFGAERSSDDLVGLCANFDQYGPSFIRMIGKGQNFGQMANVDFSPDLISGDFHSNLKKNRHFTSLIALHGNL